VFILDSLLVSGLRFVLDKVALAAEAEMDDESRLREALLEAQLQLEAGEISDAEYTDVERDILARLSTARRRRTSGVEGADSSGNYKVTGAEVDVLFTEGDDKD
jgi:hypothetical protein